MKRCLTCPFEVMRNPVHVITTKKKTNHQSVFLLPNLSPFHLMYSAGSYYWVGGFTTVPSLFPSSQSLLSNSSLYCLSFLFLDPQCVVNRSWVGVSTSCHLAGTPLISPQWQLCLSFISPPSETPLYNLFLTPFYFLGFYSDWVLSYQGASAQLYRKVYQGPQSYCIAIVFFVSFITPSNPTPLSDTRLILYYSA